MTRTPIAFVHVPRTGGNSIYRAIQQRYPNSLKVKMFGVPLIARNHGYDVIYGHMTFGLHHFTPVRYATVVREPVSRVLSHFRLHQFQASNKPGVTALGLDAFVEDEFWQNLQTRFVQDLDAFEIVGLFEELDRFAGALDITLPAERHAHVGDAPTITGDQRRRILRHNAEDVALYERARAAAG